MSRWKRRGFEDFGLKKRKGAPGWDTQFSLYRNKWEPLIGKIERSIRKCGRLDQPDYSKPQQLSSPTRTVERENSGKFHEFAVSRNRVLKGLSRSRMVRTVNSDHIFEWHQFCCEPFLWILRVFKKLRECTISIFRARYGCFASTSISRRTKLYEIQDKVKWRQRRKKEYKVRVSTWKISHNYHWNSSVFVY